MRILLVEDDELIGQAVKSALNGASSAVDWVQDGELALSSLKVEDYSLILLDLGLPGKSGLEILDAIKDLNKIPDLDIKNSITYFTARISGMSGSETQRLIHIALKYPPRVRAFLGAILSEEVAAPLKSSLNPLSVFKLGIGEDELPNAAKWNIE